MVRHSQSWRPGVRHLLRGLTDAPALVEMRHNAQTGVEHFGSRPASDRGPYRAILPLLPFCLMWVVRVRVTMETETMQIHIWLIFIGLFQISLPSQE